MKITVQKLDIIGAVLTYTVKKWVDDIDACDGGYWDDVEKEYKTPMINIDFMATTDIDLVIGGVYISENKNSNKFHAIDKHTIVNQSMEVRSFSIPEDLILLSTL